MINLDWLDSYKFETLTKRIILSVTRKVFDPVDLLCLVLLIPKLLLQWMWKENIPWDSEVNANIKEEFTSWFSELHLLKEVTISRCFSIDPSRQNISLHTLCDASHSAFAAAVYIRVETSENVQVHLLAAKARVASVKPMTISRLELMAAMVGARLCASVVEGLQWKHANSIIGLTQRLF
ncbi:uncharacterized protein LOC118206007 [Stegodyphus dumicola]|uniref:uncharacterized protein LOC118206007 n=1 Tax=Stegodyphus dumicola TaxID=202533 RepID=UPI0015AA3F6C|nr:uncharacterized protein LOC118206007 [Stegodyphus dumicola]